MVFDMKHGLGMKRLRENRLYGQIIDFRANVSYPNRILRKTVRASLFSFKSRREKKEERKFSPDGGSTDPALQVYVLQIQ